MPDVGVNPNFVLNIDDSDELAEAASADVDEGGPLSLANNFVQSESQLERRISLTPADTQRLGLNPDSLQGLHNPEIEVRVPKLGIYLRPANASENCLQGLCRTIANLCNCFESQPAEVTEPPHRHLYLGKQKDYEHLPGPQKDTYMQKPPHIDDEEDTVFTTNYISTMKYNPYLFVPMNLFEQLQRAANFYFFVIALISVFASKYSSSPAVTTVTPLLFVLGITMAKEAIEDYNRYKMDEEQNQRKVDVWNGEDFDTQIKWEHIKVGDVIKITTANPQIPADILLLQSSEGKGLANIETSNLDGETNLKAKQAPLDTAMREFGSLDGSDFLVDLSLVVESEAPNEKMGSKGWKGTLTVSGEEKTPLSMNSLILRGCSLRNTEWIIAIVVFTGKDTKVMLNNKEAPTKQSHLDNTMDWLLLRVFTVQILGIIIGSVGYVVWRSVHQDDYWYMYINNPDANSVNAFENSDQALGSEGLKRIFTFLTLLSVLVPISLYVTVEICKMVQTFFINTDLEMRYLDDEEKADLAEGKLENTNKLGIWATCRTTALNDEIGRINWVFSDKTGTLTRNEMDFLHCFVCDSTASLTSTFQVRNMASAAIEKNKEQICHEIAKMAHVENAASVGLTTKDNTVVFSFPVKGRQQAEKMKGLIQKFSVGGMQFTDPNTIVNYNPDGKTYGPGESEKANEVFSRIPVPNDSPAYDKKECRFNDNRLAWEAKLNQKSDTADLFLTALATCHTVVPEEPEDLNNPFDFKYQAASPDEKALVIFAKNMYYFFHDVGIESLNIPGGGGVRKIDGSIEIVRIRGVDYKFEIMAVIEFSSHRKRQSTILRDPRDGKIKLFCKGADNIILQRLTEESKKTNWPSCEDNLKQFAKTGLRTLCIAYKELSQQEFIDWWDKLEDAKNDIDHKDERVPMVEESIEEGLTLLGATAIEDRLQEGVPDTIASLHFAGLNIWVLTGDKVETAINIGRSCRLITENMKPSNNSLFVIDIDEKLEDDVAREATMKRLREAQEHMDTVGESDKKNQGLVLSGKALGFVFPIRARDAMGREIPPTAEEKAKEEELQEMTLGICRKCSAVLCCRVSPKQKAQMVELVKYNEADAITLAIGDGANDVPMIKAAHVGVGIKGHEGVQAVMASDYSIGQFAYLQELLFKHGAWNYRRLSKGVLYFFLKNITVTMTQLYFAFISGFSGVNYWDFYLAPNGFNLIFTSFPVLFLICLDRPYSREVAKLCPEIYMRDEFNLYLFYYNFWRAMVNSAIIFCICTYMTDGAPFKDGQTADLVASYTTTFTAVLTVVSLQIMLEFTIWHKVTIAFFALSWASWFLIESWFAANEPFFLAESDLAKHWLLYKGPSRVFSTWRFWLVLVTATGVVMLLDLCLRWARKIKFYDKEECIKDMYKTPEVLEEFLSKLKAARDAHNEKDYNPDVEHFKGYAPTHADTHITGESLHRKSKIQSRTIRKYAKSAMMLPGMGVGDGPINTSIQARSDVFSQSMPPSGMMVESGSQDSSHRKIRADKNRIPPLL